MFPSALSFCLVLGLGGSIIHLIPLFKEMGSDGRTAALFAWIIGVSSAIGRLLIGLALERFPARLVTTLVLARGAVGWRCWASAEWPRGRSWSP